jgi:hypothetical protein
MVFLFRSEKKFRTTQEFEYLFLFFQNLTLGYMTKTLNHIFFFPPPKSEYFFQQQWESEYFFRKKTIPLPPFKLNGRSLTSCVPYVASLFRLHFCDFRFRFSLTFM